MRIIDFYKKRWVFYTISGAIMLLGIVMSFVNGVNLDIQFKGGALLKYNYVGELTTSEVSSVVSAAAGRSVSVQLTSDIATNERHLVLNFAGNEGMEATVQQTLLDAMTAAFPDSNIELSESNVVEPFIGRQFLTNGIIAILVAFALVIIYVAVRFRRIGGLSAGVMAVLALVHDVMVVFFACTIFGIPISESFIAVALSIIGYSINDTIVIYDRIRENERLARRPVDELVNLSISQCFARTINTSLTVVVAMGLLYVIALLNNIDSVTNFALPMMFGAICGCYSSMCIATTLWVMWKKRDKSEEIKRRK